MYGDWNICLNCRFIAKTVNFSLVNHCHELLNNIKLEGNTAAGLHKIYPNHEACTETWLNPVKHISVLTKSPKTQANFEDVVNWQYFLVEQHSVYN